MQATAAAALCIAKVDSTVHERHTRRMLNFHLRFCSCTAYYAWQMCVRVCVRCVSKCAQIMLIIVTQLAREGHGEGVGGEGHRNLTLMDAFPGRNGRRLFHAVEQQLLSLAAPTLQFSHFSLTLCLPPLFLSPILCLFYFSCAL